MRPVSRHNRPWDLLVVGGGTAGIVAGQTAAQLGARVAMLEPDRPGGDCLWTGCVPSKALIAAAAAATGVRRAPALGVHASGPEVDFPAVMKHVRAAIAAIEPADAPETLTAAGVEVIAARGVFVGRHTVEAGGRRIAFQHALVATGPRPALPDVPGLVTARPLTTESVWDLRSLPGRMLVLGGGSSGCELGQAFARLGTQVTVVDAAPRLLPEEDPDASALVHSALREDDVRVLTGHRAARVDGSSGGGGEATLQGGSGATVVGYDALLVTTGRRPSTEGLGLDSAGVALDERGAVQVDRTLQTSNPAIWAAGDVSPHPRYTHVAGVHGSIAATNAVLGLRRRIDLTAVPRVTFTDPEVAAVGAPSWRTRGRAPRTVTRRHDSVDRAITDGRPEGFARLVLDRRHRLVGATLVGPRAGESLAELTLAVRQRLTTGDVVGSVHAYPTFADGIWNAAIADVTARLRSPLVRRLTGLAVTVRRSRSSRSG